MCVCVCVRSQLFGFDTSAAKTRQFVVAFPAELNTVSLLKIFHGDKFNVF